MIFGLVISNDSHNYWRLGLTKFQFLDPLRVVFSLVWMAAVVRQWVIGAGHNGVVRIGYGGIVLVWNW